MHQHSFQTVLCCNVAHIKVSHCFIFVGGRIAHPHWPCSHRDCPVLGPVPRMGASGVEWSQTWTPPPTAPLCHMDEALDSPPVQGHSGTWSFIGANENMEGTQRCFNES